VNDDVSRIHTEVQQRLGAISFCTKIAGCSALAASASASVFRHPKLLSAELLGYRNTNSQRCACGFAPDCSSILLNAVATTSPGSADS